MTLFERIGLSAWILLASLAGLLQQGWLSLGSVERFHLCLFKALWGIPCPGCGMAHAMLAAFQNDWAGSFQAHPFGPVVWILWTLWLGQGLYNKLRGHSFSDHSFLGKISPLTQMLLLISLLAVYAWRQSPLCNPL